MNHQKLSPSPLYAGERTGERGENRAESTDVRFHKPFAPLPNPLPGVPGRGSIRGAFTLIELLLVLVILAVLAAVVVPKFAGRSEQARITAAKTDISMLEGQLDIFEQDCGRYPSSEEGLRALVESPPNLPQGKWKGPYIKRGLPSDPWNNAYVYRYPGQHNVNSYDLYSTGPDGREGNDDIDNWSPQQ